MIYTQKQRDNIVKGYLKKIQDSFENKPYIRGIYAESNNNYICYKYLNDESVYINSGFATYDAALTFFKNMDSTHNMVEIPNIKNIGEENVNN